MFIILSTCNDIRKDSFLALLTNYKNVELYIETREIAIKDMVLKNINYQLEGGTLNDKDIRNEYAIMRKLIESKNDISVKAKIILFEHEMEAATLNWRYSFLLRLMK